MITVAGLSGNFTPIARLHLLAFRVKEQNNAPKIVIIIVLNDRQVYQFLYIVDNRHFYCKN